MPITKIASCCRQMAGLPPNLHKMVPRCACIQGVLKVKVKVKGHVLKAVLCWHEKRFSSQRNGRISTKLAHDGLQVSMDIGFAQFQGQGQRSRDTGTLVLDLKSLFLAGKRLDCDQTSTRWSTGEQLSMHPGCAQGQGQRSRDTGTLMLDLKSLFLAGKWLDCDQTCTRWSAGQPASSACSRSRSRSKVT